jgi:hypothetical protein
MVKLASFSLATNMSLTTFEFVDIKDWCTRALDKHDFMHRSRTWLPLFAPSLAKLCPPERVVPDDHVSDRLFLTVPSTGGLTVKDLVERELAIGGSLVANLGKVTIKADSLLVLVNEHLAITEGYGDARWLRYQVKTWPNAHHHLECFVGKRFGLKRKMHINAYDTLEDILVIDRPCLYLTARQDDKNIYHWLYETLPRLYSLDVIPQLRELPLLVRDPLTAFQLATLKRLGVYNEIIPTFGKSVLANALYFASIPSPTTAHRESVLWLRASLASTEPSEAPLKRRRLFISRSDAKIRRVINEEEVLRQLAPLGFERIVMSGLTLAEQIAAFKSAEFIVMAHGAAGANLIFASLDCRVIELHSPKWPNSVYYTICKALGHEYSYMFGLHQNKLLDYSIDGFALKQYICKLLSSLPTVV